MKIHTAQELAYVALSFNYPSSPGRDVHMEVTIKLKTGCYALNVCVCPPPPISYVKALTPNVTILGGGSFGM